MSGAQTMGSIPGMEVAGHDAACTDANRSPRKFARHRDEAVQGGCFCPDFICDFCRVTSLSRVAQQRLFELGEGRQFAARKRPHERQVGIV